MSATFLLQKDIRITVGRLTALSYLATVVISSAAFVRSERILQIAPLAKSLARLPGWTDLVVLMLQISLLTFLTIKPLNKSASSLSLACTIFWVLQDVGRLEPFIYMYAFTSVMLILTQERHSSVIVTLRIMVIGTYFWAGFQKLNVNFYLVTLPWFVQPLYQLNNHGRGLNTFVCSLGFLIPFLEMAIGILLISQRTRRLASLMALCMLVVVFGCLGPFGHNWNKAVWPWNLWLVGMELILFYPSSATAFVSATRFNFKPDLAQWASLMLFCALPPLGNFGVWPAYASFKLYSSNTMGARAVLATDETRGALPGAVRHLLRGDTLYLLDLQMQEFEFAELPDRFVFKESAKGLCRYLSDPKNATLVVMDAPPFNRLAGRKVVEPLCPDRFEPENRGQQDQLQGHVMKVQVIASPAPSNIKT